MASSEQTCLVKMCDNSTHCHQSQRYLDILYCGIHLCFLLLLSLVLIILGCFTALQNCSSKMLIPYPGHKRKWIMSSLLILVLLCGVGEGVLTDLTRNSVTQPHLYVPQSCAMLCGLISLVYYNYLEYWNRPHLTWLLFLYWPTAVAIDVVRLIKQTEEIGFDITIMRQVVILTCIVIYGCMLCLEVNLIRTKILGWCYNEKAYPTDVNNKRMFYRFNYGNLLSKVMFSSLNWLFVLGYQRPLEMDDLGCLPSDFECRNVYKVFKKAYDSEKARALQKNRPSSLWKAYVRAYGRQILLGVSINVLADICLIVIPLAIGGVISYATREYFSEEQPTENLCYVTINEFFRNGYVLVLVICVSTLARAVLLRLSHIMFDWYAIRVQSALQAFTYEKSLHLSTSSLSSGDMTVGQITNHMSVDATAIFWFTMYQPWLWTGPIIARNIHLYRYICVCVYDSYNIH
ncbi:ATP-binding cassette sub-family C member 9-like [Ptychodera flava]|uniref:ATP-binding cassette sub-family C member 9-like n=1 Tax=Ptychodera flava TaxID=63121 RepID=UPI00396AA6B6